MRAHFPKKPYVISKYRWDDYYKVQQSGKMNMMGHPSIGYFCNGDAWQKAFNHFETDAHTTDLLIE